MELYDADEEDAVEAVNVTVDNGRIGTRGGIERVDTTVKLDLLG